MARHDFPFNMYDIFRLVNLNIPLDGRSNYEMNCPVCGKHTLSVSFIKDNFRCFNSNCAIQGGLLQFYAYYMGRDGVALSAIRKEIMNELYGFEDASDDKRKKEIQDAMEKRKALIKSKEIPQNKTRNVDDRNNSYSCLLDMLSLSNDHEKNLEKRGLSHDTIIQRKYKTFPVSAFEEYPLKLMEEGLYVDGIPGFFTNDNGKWELRRIKRGIMIPILNRNNKIEGFQIRKDDNLLKTWYKKDSKGNYELDENKMRVLEKEKKFSWLSSKGLKDGAEINGFIHYACDFVLENDVWVPKLPSDRGILLTEGPLKGDIFFEKTSYPAIAVPGVSCQYRLSIELDFLKERGFTTIYNGYDMDYDTNPNVYNALEACYEMILSKGFKLKRVLWNPEFKGIDDYYVGKERGK